MSHGAIFNRVMDVLKKELSKEEWVAFCVELDAGADILDCVNEYMVTIDREMYSDPASTNKIEEVALEEPARDGRGIDYHAYR